MESLGWPWYGDDEGSVQKARRPFKCTLFLDGKASEAVDHLTLDDLMREDGAQMVWKLLQIRFPEKETEDQTGEALGEVFGLESMQQWTARVQEEFQKCRRKAEAGFPSPAQRWIALICASLSEKLKAIVKEGKLDLPTVMAPLRSCFPQSRASAAKARKPVSTTLLAEDTTANETATEVDGFGDIEEYPSINTFRFGNGAMEVSERACRIPAAIGQKLGTIIDGAIIHSQAPLLLGRTRLKKLGVTIDFKRRVMTFLDQKVPVAMHTNAAGQLLIHSLNLPQ